VSPDVRWIAAVDTEYVIYLWPMPDLSSTPLHTLPHEELLIKLKSLTNLRAVPDDTRPSGYRIAPDLSAYRGWAEVPTW
jgi:hypothetical protein